MRTTATVALRPENEAPRLPVQGKRGTNFVNHDAILDTIAGRRVQYLGRRFDLPASRAGIIATLAFEVWRG